MKHVLIFLIKVYRTGISPYFPPSCRYHPTCSRYAMDAIQKYGAFSGTWMAIKRISRCHPWAEGGYDPVPGTDQEFDSKSGRKPETKP